MSIKIATTNDLVAITMAMFLLVCSFGVLVAITGSIINWFREKRETGDANTESEVGK